ncbi:MAG: Rieske 2Fe-2S domain-containing protein [Oscillatoriales cyanobacterium RM2_1_1]|nr:Rieske 2Fe-2S domain-containing protein [Oscillatoriales cyanobacterium SM2_3_0]NJO44527.1 Rieske 2Fe-2S domain-containing protein [Oscillatoriales cyanobacterium RM2_1_1]
MVQNIDQTKTQSSFPGFPNSWFRIATSGELPPKKILPLHYLGRDFVLFRADGTPRLLDAFCPHLGAHLGYGSTLQGDTIRCPYHGWRWHGTGRCVEIPYLDKQLPQVQIQTWPVREVNGLILMYYHHQAQLPDWEIPAVPELSSSRWTPLKSVRRWQVQTTLKHYMENSVDVSHLSNLHRQTFSSAKSLSLEANGPILTHRMAQKYNLSSLAAGKLIDEDGGVTTIYYGPAYDVSYYWTQGRIKLELLTIFTGTPVDQTHLDIEIFFSVKKMLPSPLNGILTGLLKRDVAHTFEQDLPILENRVDLDHPIVYEEDGPIKASLRWANQFYPVSPEPEG